MNFKEYAPLALRTAKPLEHERQVEHAQLGLVSEIGELADSVKRAAIYLKEFDKVNGKEELGDYCWYLNLLADETKLHPGVIDDALAITNLGSNTSTDVQVTLLLASMTGAMCVPDGERGVAMSEIIVLAAGLIASLALRWDTTIAECLDTNIAKLAKRYGDKYSDYAALNRDLPGERKILEA